MKPLALLAACSLLAIPVLAEETKLPPEARKALQQTARFHAITKVADLPAGVRALVDEDPKNIANPGEDWQVTDVVDPGKPLPGKHLAWAATDGDYTIVHYETGGIAHLFHTLVAKGGQKGGKAEEVWKNMGLRSTDLPSFLEALAKVKR